MQTKIAHQQNTNNHKYKNNLAQATLLSKSTKQTTLNNIVTHSISTVKPQTQSSNRNLIIPTKQPIQHTTTYTQTEITLTNQPT